MIDFGSGLVCEPTEPRPYHTRFYGTAAFASPEIISNQPWQAAPAEVWALGVLLSYLLRGESPFKNEDDRRAGNVKLDEASLKRMSEGVVMLMKRCLHADPAQRASVFDVRDDPWLRDGFERLERVREADTYEGRFDGEWDNELQV